MLCVKLNISKCAFTADSLLFIQSNQHLDTVCYISEVGWIIPNRFENNIRQEWVFLYIQDVQLMKNRSNNKSVVYILYSITPCVPVANNRHQYPTMMQDTCFLKIYSLWHPRKQEHCFRMRIIFFLSFFFAHTIAVFTL